MNASFFILFAEPISWESALQMTEVKKDKGFISFSLIWMWNVMDLIT